MDVTKEIKMIMLEENLNQDDLAKLLETTQSNISKKFNSNNYRVNELEKIANLLGYKLELKFIKKEN